MMTSRLSAPAASTEEFWQGLNASANQPHALEQTIDIPAWKQQATLDLIADFNRRSERLGLPAITVRVSEASDLYFRVVSNQIQRFTPEEVRNKQSDPILAGLILQQANPWTLYRVSRVKVHLSGSLPVYNGWHLVGVADYTHSKPTLRTLTQPEAVPTLPPATLLQEPVCQHCNEPRNRKQLYLVQHRGTGQSMQVGSTCLKDFTGLDSAEAQITMLATFWSTVNHHEESFDRELITRSPQNFAETFCLLPFLTAVVLVAAETGFITATRAEKEKISATSHDAMALVTNNFQGIEQQARDRAEATAAEVIKHVAAKEPGSSEFMQKAVVICEDGWFDPRKETGIAAYAHQIYTRDVEKALVQASAPQPIDEYLGKPKQRLSLSVTFSLCHSCENEWGHQWLFVGTTDDGHTVKLYSKRRLIPGTDTQTGQRIAIKGTVKEHASYKGLKQTVLTRVVSLQQELHKAVRVLLHEVMASGVEASDEQPDLGGAEQLNAHPSHDLYDALIYLDSQLNRVVVDFGTEESGDGRYLVKSFDTSDKNQLLTKAVMGVHRLRKEIG